MTHNGKLQYTLKNDYMFKAVFQKNEKLLKGLLSSLLNVSMDTITELQIRNPIVLGETINNKTVILDILVEMNHTTLINVELQVVKQSSWVERSITYLGKTVNHLEVGDDYEKMLTTVHIGILDFELFEGETLFYSRNVLMDEETHRIYSRKIGLNVLCLKNIEYATQRDRESGLYYWAKLFEAETWEDLKAIAGGDVRMSDVVMTLAELSEDEKIRMQCEARERYEQMVRMERAAEERQRRVLEEALKAANEKVEAANEQVKEANARVQSAVVKNEQLEAELQQLRAQLAELKDNS